MTVKESYLVAFLAFIIAFSIVAYAYNQTIPRLDVLAVSQIYVEPKGYEDPTTHEWKGSFWVVLATSSTTENFLFYKFDKSETEQPYASNKIGDKTLIPKATIKITVTALQPYWKIGLVKKTYVVFPKTYAMGMNKILRNPYKITDTYVDPLTVDVWETTGYWEHHAPFQIVVEKTGDYYWKSDPIVIDLVGPTATKAMTITSPKGESLKIKLIGQLNTGYGQPPWSDLMIFSPDYAFIGSSKLRAIISYDKDDMSYSNYWFGGGNYYVARHDPDTGTYYPNARWKVLRWSDDGSPAHYFIDELDILPIIQTVCPVWGDEFPGVYRTDTLTDYIVKPIRPKDAFTDVPTASPYGKSLIRYLIEDIKAEKVNLNYYGTKYEVTDTSLKIYQPIGAVSWLYTLWISTELADTFVYQPIAANGKITSIRWLSSGTSYAEIGGKDVALVTVKQLSSETSRVIVEASTSTSLAKIIPESDSAILEPNEERTFSFIVENLGATSEVTGEISFNVYNDLGSQTDSSKLTFKLLPTGIGDTILTVYTVDAKTKTKLSGIFVSIAYGSETDTKATVNGMATFNLGSYQGTVQISTAETFRYRSTSTSMRVQSGQNTAYLELIEKTAPEPPWYIKYWWMIIIAIVAIITIIIVAVMKK